jgi:hypothetical protein
MAEKKKVENNVMIYEIRLQGYLESKWSEWFYGMTITHEGDDTTTLYGPLPDQTVLHSVMDRIRDMNLPLVSVNLIVSDGQANNSEVKGVRHEELPIHTTKNRTGGKGEI